MPPRKSTRLSRTDKLKRVEVASDNDTEKRKRSLSKDDHGSGARKSIKKTKDGRMVDNFCWRCHEQGYDKICSTCPRVYHDNCLLKADKFTAHDVCPECQLQSLDGTKPSPDLTPEMMDKVLVCLIRRLLPVTTTAESFGAENHSKGRFSKKKDKIPTNIPELMKWPEKKHKTCKPVDLEMIIEAVKSGGSYSRTVDFFSDIQWIYHNSYKCFGAQSEITKAASKIVKAVKNELLDIEACHECYYNNYNEIDLYDADPFGLLCKNLHTLVFAKLKGHPFWPAKCLKVIDGKAQVQFFGTHDKSLVEARACYLMSRSHPNPKHNSERESYKSAHKDFDNYKTNYERKYGPYPFAGVRVPFLPADNWHWVKERPQFQLSSPNRKGARKSMHGRTAARLENRLSRDPATENEETDHNTGGDSWPDIVISSIIGISNEDAFQDNCEPQTAQNSDQSASFYSYHPATNSWTSQLHFVCNSSFNLPNVSVCIPRLDDSVAIQYQQRQIQRANSRINLSTSHPGFIDLQPCDESERNVHESVATSRGGRQVLGHSERINSTSGFSSNDNQNSAQESLNARSPNGRSREDLENIRSFMGLSSNLREIDPEMLELILDGGHYVKESGMIMLQYSKGYSKGIMIMSAALKYLKRLDSEFRETRRKIAELKAEASQNRCPSVYQIINGTKILVKRKMEEEFMRQKNRLDAEMKNIQNMLLFHQKEHSNYIQRIYHETHQNKSTQFDGLTKEEAEEWEREIILEKMKLEQENNDKIFEMRSQVWCIKCQKLGKIYCCWNTYYCTEDCRIKHLASHHPSCRRRKSLSGHSVMIEEITSSQSFEDDALGIQSPMIVEEI